MNVAELRALDVPVVFVELVIEDIRVGEIRVECLDNLLGFVRIEPERLGFFDASELSTDGFLGAHNNSIFRRQSLKDSRRGNGFLGFRKICLPITRCGGTPRSDDEGYITVSTNKHVW